MSSLAAEAPAPLRTQRLREEIVRAAAACFGDKGYRATTLDEVAARAGVSRATLYNYVRRKEELLCHVFEGTMGSFREALDRVLAQGLPPDETLREIVRLQVSRVAKDVSFLKVFFDEESGLPPSIARRISREKRGYERAIEGVVEAGIEAGRLRPMEARLVVLALLGMCNWLTKWYRPDSSPAPEAIASQFVELIERGIRPASRSGTERGDRLLVVEEKLDAVMRALDVGVPGLPRQTGGSRRRSDSRRIR